MQVWNFLKGKKTYVVAVIAIVLNVGVHYNWWTVADVAYWNTLLAGVGLATVRHAISGN